MASYQLEFEWPEGARVESDQPRPLYGQTVEVAQFSAAVVYAGVSSQDPAPTAYRIVAETGEVVFRYPKEPRSWTTAAVDPPISKS